jgi:membrane protease YdiL (CAAX protease family)
MQFALFFTGLLWLLAARSAADHSAQGIATRFGLSQYPEALLAEAFFLFLLLTGFTALHWIATREGGIRETNALRARPTAIAEMKLGAVVGWAMLLLAVLPMMLLGDLHPTFWLVPRAWMLALSSLVTLAFYTLALEVGFRGYLFRRLIASIGPTPATLLLSAIYALLSTFRPNSTVLSVFITFLLGILFSMAYLRTHALWLGWGLHFAWDAAMAVILGLPLAGVIDYNTLVDTNISGSAFVTGGPYGPESAGLTIACVLLAMFALYRLTRDYAWAYTHVPIVAAGHPMDVPPPAEHTAMEKAAAPAPLVQILSTTASNPSTSPEVERHLRQTAGSGADTL